MNGYPELHEDGGSLSITVGPIAEKIVCEVVHDKAKLGQTRQKCWEVKCSSNGGVLALTSGRENGNWQCRSVDVDDWCSRHEEVAADTGVGNGGIVQ